MNFFRRSAANTQGVICLIAALACLTVSDSIIKWLSPTLPLHEVTLIRSCFALVFVLVFVYFEGGFKTLKTRRPLLHLLRGSMMVLANMFFFIALAAMPLAETVTLFYTAPLFICILSQPVLGEKVGLAGWLTILLGLLGVVVMLRPGSEIFSLISLLPILAAVSYAAMTMLTRKLGITEKAGALTFYIQIAFIAISAGVGLMVGDGEFDRYDNAALGFLLRPWIWPDLQQWQLLLACGFIVSFGGYLISQAYRLGEASAVAPFEYASLPFALLVGYYLWGDWPDGPAIVGTVLIIGSGLTVVLLHSRMQQKSPQPLQTDP